MFVDLPSIRSILAASSIRHSAVPPAACCSPVADQTNLPAFALRLAPPRSRHGECDAKCLLLTQSGTSARWTTAQLDFRGGK